MRWTCKSTPHLAKELQAKGHTVSQRSVCDLPGQPATPARDPQDPRGRRQSHRWNHRRQGLAHLGRTR
ncbi:MAG: hypothetical protein EOM22_08515 [Gammaproteobacteria bacterium]|nr:hypothetical protein [Gammaproteobacteria bacterium]